MAKVPKWETGDCQRGPNCLVVCHELLTISLEYELHLQTSSDLYDARALLMSGCSLQDASQLLARADGARRSDVPRARCSAAMAKTGLPALEGLGCPYRYRSLLLPQEPGIFDQRLEHRFLEGSGCPKLACQRRHVDDLMSSRSSDTWSESTYVQPRATSPKQPEGFNKEKAKLESLL